MPDMFTSSSFSISGNDEGEEDNESDDELDDDVPWRAPSEKIAYVFRLHRFSDFFVFLFFLLFSFASTFVLEWIKQ